MEHELKPLEKRLQSVPSLSSEEGGRGGTQCPEAESITQVTAKLVTFKLPEPCTIPCRCTQGCPKALNTESAPGDFIFRQMTFCANLNTPFPSGKTLLGNMTRGATELSFCQILPLSCFH